MLHRHNFAHISALLGVWVVVFVVAGTASAFVSDWQIAQLSGMGERGEFQAAGDIDGDGYGDVVVGYPNATEPVYGHVNAGLVQVVYGSATGPGNGRPDDMIYSGMPGGNFGTSVATAGDMNGDGYDDVIVGIPGWEQWNGISPVDLGRVEVFLGGANGLSLSPVWSATGTAEFTMLGWEVSTAGDLDNDGFDDIVYRGGGGSPYVVYGSASGPDSSKPPFNLPWVGTYYGFGTVAPAGDVNGDGYADLIVGRPNYPNGPNSTGRLHLYLGGAAGVQQIHSQSIWLTPTGSEYISEMGLVVAMAGDVNGDGYGDVLVGAPGDGEVVGSSIHRIGRFLVFEGTSAGLNTTPLWSHWNPDGYVSYPLVSSYGFFGATAGDVNADGYADLVLGASDYYSMSGVSHVGRVEIFHGSATGPDLAVSEVQEGSSWGTYLGRRVACVGDVDGDGRGDVMSGTRSNYDPIYGFAGHSGELDVAAQWWVDGAGTGGRAGQTVAVLGDINGDGFADVAVGTPTYLDIRGKIDVYRGTQYGVETSGFIFRYGTAHR